MNTERLVPKHIRDLAPYTPIVPVDVLAQRAGIPMEKVIKLDGNENVYGCSPRVQRALADYKSYHIYPDPGHTELKKALAKYAGVGPENIVAGSGSDELIDLVLRLFIEPGDEVIDCVPSFMMYRFNAEVCAARVVPVPRDEAYAINVPAIKKAVTDRTKIIFIATPNNPTTTLTPPEKVLQLLDTGVIVVVDEAYYEFSGVTMAHLVPNYENLIVLRTFSKWAGLAGLRAGYGIMSPKMVDFFYKMKPPYNVNIAAQIGMLESLQDMHYLKHSIKLILEERPRFSAALKKQGMLAPMPSQANFLFCPVVVGEAKHIWEELAKRGIFVRYFNVPLLKNAIRLSVGRPEHTEAIVKALDEIRGKMNV